MEDILTTVGEKIRLLRKSRDLTQENVAELLKMSHSAYAKMERGETDVTLKKLDHIAQVFGIKAVDILQIGQPQAIENSYNGDNNFTVFGNGSISVPENSEVTINKRLEMLDMALQRLLNRMDKMEGKLKSL